MFMEPDLVGLFAVSAKEYSLGDARALFRLFIATTLFQRRQDQQVLRILRSLTASQVQELCSVQGLLRQAATSECRFSRSQDRLLDDCDLSKDINGKGICRKNPGVACHLKRHSEWLRRYGHFGKVPTSAAFVLRDAGVGSLRMLYESTLLKHPEPRARAEALAATIQRSWRVSEKIAGMFLSMVTNPDLGRIAPPWTGVDWTYFVAIDSNTDAFLQSLEYSGSGSYSARRKFLWEIAARVDLSKLKVGLNSYNPRIVQQAAYLFMSRNNRRVSALDCSNEEPSICGRCPRLLKSRCAFRGSRDLPTTP